MKIMKVSAVIVSAMLISVNCMAQCEGRYESEIFSGFTKTTVQYSDVYEVRPGDGDYLKMDIFQPDGDSFPNRPVVIMAHGGTFIAGDRTEQTCVEICQMLAKSGYVTASIDYRLANSQTELLDSINALNIALRSVSDMRAAVRYFRQDAATANTYRIDPNQVFVGGNSAGAVTALHAAYVDDTAELPSYLKTIISQNGGLEGNSGNPGYPTNVSGVINLAGGINKLIWIEPADVPMVSCHGNQDPTVPYNCGNVLYSFLDAVVDLCGSGAMKTRCDQVGTDNTLYTYSGDGHVPWESNLAKRTSMKQHVADFMKTHTECSSATVINKINNDLNFLIYPNPSEGLLKIEIRDNSENNTAVIYDCLGKEMKRFNLTSQSSQLDVSSLSSGYYLIKVFSNNGKVTGRSFSKI